MLGHSDCIEGDKIELRHGFILPLATFANLAALQGTDTRNILQNSECF